MNIGEAMLAVRDGKKVQMDDNDSIVFMAMGKHFLETGFYSKDLKIVIWDHKIDINRTMMESREWKVADVWDY